MRFINSFGEFSLVVNDLLCEVAQYKERLTLFFNASTLYCKHYKVLQNKTLNKQLNKLHYFTQKSHGDYIIKTYSKHRRGFHRE